MKKRKFYVVFGVLFLQIVTSITLATSVTYGMDYAKAPQGFQVWGIDLSGLNQEEAYQRLEGEMPSEVSYQDSMYPLTVTQSQEGLRDWLNSQFAPESNSWWVNALNNLKRMGPKQLSPEFLDRNEIYPQLENMAQQINQQGMPASIQMQTGHFTIQKGSPTIVMDVPASWEKLNQSGGSKSVPLVVNSQEIAPNEKDLQKIKDKIGDYTTFFDSTNGPRTNNVFLAAKALDGQLIKPGGEFSFNQIVGKRDKEKGYLPAYTFVDQKVVLDDGGGICQDSSTLYHAVRQAQLQVLERNTHSLPVTYVPKGQDATVAYGLLDFRFRNTTRGYVYLDVRMGSNWLRIQIYGVADAEHPVLAEPDGYPIKPEFDMK
ncbi:VanW family protein [Desulfitobacterium metallireducens]|uniref:VanW family protein n=1 Tax=Desulfitobacterium metallireducens DSM 15288 TaxID=871968 RepID=W0EB10_9FIRM|nr:VanW family protein [Desulfitobacterium metallireducens]AHF06693.1 VanW family protein [Desulfitobacterium metallireducens DSM 15288]